MTNFRLISKVLLFVGLTFTGQSCDLFKSNDPKPKAELDKLPPITHEGKNTFGCLVNGKAFVVTNTSQMAAIYQGGGLDISGGANVENQFQTIEINVAEIISSGTSFDLFNDTNHKGQFYDENSLCFYFTNTENRGFIKITFFDSNKFIVSGQFQFDSASSDCSGTVKITEGRFDMQYIP